MSDDLIEASGCFAMVEGLRPNQTSIEPFLRVEIHGANRKLMVVKVKILGIRRHLACFF
jgi:hypothetical protein